jgi:hypothetical protein
LSPNPEPSSAAATAGLTGGFSSGGSGYTTKLAGSFTDQVPKQMTRISTSAPLVSRIRRRVSVRPVTRVLALGALAFALIAAAMPEGVPPYEHVVLIVEENHSRDGVMESPYAPNIRRLAAQYGYATDFFGEVHVSEGNYVAMLGGSTNGIHDDAPYSLPDHTVTGPSLMSQLEAKKLTWRGYFEDIPAPGSGATYSEAGPGRPQALYASKHNGFMNFKSVQDDPKRATKIVGFPELYRDLAAGAQPNFAVIVPNQCNEMHGLSGPDVPADCRGADDEGRIRRGDAMTGKLVAALQGTKAWNGAGNFAIVVTWDEDYGVSPGPQGCCGYEPASAGNFGGGRIPTIVITNHGPRGRKDPTPYNHYSLLRTIEDAFGISEHLRIAADEKSGVHAMTPLFSK